MASKNAPSSCLSEHSALVLLALLLCGDFVYIAIHIANALLHHIPLYSIEFDHSYSEFYGYMKLLWVCLLLIYIQTKQTTWHYTVWILMFTYLLIDDSIQIHEVMGYRIAKALEFMPSIGLRAYDFGELIVSLTAGAILSVPLVAAYTKGSAAFRKVSHDLALFVCLLGGFGVAVDMLHSVFGFNRVTKFLFGIIEDGGEMLTVSFLLWYVFLMAIRQGDSGCYLCGWIKNCVSRLYPASKENAI